MIADNMLTEDTPMSRPITYTPAVIRRFFTVPEGFSILLIGASDGVPTTIAQLTRDGYRVEHKQIEDTDVTTKLPVAVLVLECPGDDNNELGPRLKALIDRWRPAVHAGGVVMGTGYHPFYLGVPDMLNVEFDSAALGLATPGIWWHIET